MKKATKTAAEISERLNLPVGVTRITLAGTRQALIEGHRGLAGHTPERVTVRAMLGEVCIDGEALTLSAMDADALLISGRILSVTL